MARPNERQVASARARWPIYALIAAAAFGSGVIFDQMILRPSQNAQQQQTQQHLGVPVPANLPPTERAVALANQAYDRQNWASAIAEYERAISLGNDTPDVRTDLGNAYRFSGNPQKALEQYRIAQQQNPNHEQSLFNQGALYAQSLGDPITGAAKWREFIARFPSSPRAADARRLLSEFEAEFGTVTTTTATVSPR